MQLNSAAQVVLGLLGIPLLAYGQTWKLVRLQATEQTGARCLDGSPGAYYIKNGVGVNASNFIFFQQAGGWCESLLDCAARSRSTLGSTAADPNETSSWVVEDLLIGEPSLNPLFYNWTSVYSRYCDGASRASNVAAPVQVNATSALYYRGFSILRETISALLGPNPGDGAPSLSTASSLVIVGGSAGALGAVLHADYIAERVRTANPSIRTIRAIANDGFFIDGASIWGGRHAFTEVMQRVEAFGNITSGEADQVSQSGWKVAALEFVVSTRRLTLLASRPTLRFETVGAAFLLSTHCRIW